MAFVGPRYRTIHESETGLAEETAASGPVDRSESSPGLAGIPPPGPGLGGIEEHSATLDGRPRAGRVTAALSHWQLMLTAVAVGLALGLAVVAVSCLQTPLRLRLSASPSERVRLLRREFARVQQLGDAAAVSQEHGLPGARELYAEGGASHVPASRPTPRAV